MSNRHLAASAAAVHEKIMTCSNIYSEARTYTHPQTRTRCFADCCDVFCFVARSKLKCTSPLGYCFLLVYTTRKKKEVSNTHTHPHTRTRCSACMRRFSICLLRPTAETTAVSGCCDDPCTHTDTRVRQTAGTVSFHTSACTPCTAHYDQCVPANDVCVLGNSQDPPRLLSGSSFC